MYYHVHKEHDADLQIRKRGFTFRERANFLSYDICAMSKLVYKTRP